MTIRQEREEEIADANYSQGFQDGYTQAKKDAIDLMKTHITEQPWPYSFGIRAYHMVNIEGLVDKIHDMRP